MNQKPFKYLIASLAILSATFVWADNPGHHPFYLHALADLRDARGHLEHLSSDPVDHAEENAIHKIDDAISEIKKASIDDGKDIHDHVRVDTKLTRTDRFHKALELIDKAKADSSHEEDQGNTKGLQKRVVHRIDIARKAVQNVIETVLSHN